MSNPCPHPLTKDTLHQVSSWWRASLEPHFSGDPTASDFETTALSTGHCAAVAFLLCCFYEMELVYCKVDDQTHFINRIALDEEVWYVDLTGDQFGLPAVNILKEEELQCTQYRHIQKAPLTILSDMSLIRSLELAATLHLQSHQTQTV